MSLLLALPGSLTVTAHLVTDGVTLSQEVMCWVQKVPWGREWGEWQESDPLGGTWGVPGGGSWRRSPVETWQPPEGGSAGARWPGLLRPRAPAGPVLGLLAGSSRWAEPGPGHHTWRRVLWPGRAQDDWKDRMEAAFCRQDRGSLWGGRALLLKVSRGLPGGRLSRQGGALLGTGPRPPLVLAAPAPEAHVPRGPLHWLVIRCHQGEQLRECREGAEGGRARGLAPPCGCSMQGPHRGPVCPPMAPGQGKQNNCPSPGPLYQLPRGLLKPSVTFSQYSLCSSP